jgi:hypothetical protein
VERGGKERKKKKRREAKRRKEKEGIDNSAVNHNFLLAVVEAKCIVKLFSTVSSSGIWELVVEIRTRYHAHVRKSSAYVDVDEPSWTSLVVDLGDKVSGTTVG